MSNAHSGVAVARFSSWLSRWAVDIRPLRASPAYRRMWLGGLFSNIGNQISVFAITLQVFQMTGSAMAVGAIGLFAAIPAIVIALVGGVVGDNVDRGRLVLLTTACQAAVSCVLVAQALAGLHLVWLLYILASVQFLLGAINAPAGSSLMPQLLTKDLYRSAIALRMLSKQVSQICGPLVAGVLASRMGLTPVYIVDLLSFVGGLYGIARLPPLPPAIRIQTQGISAIREGLQFIRANHLVAGALLADLSVAFLGAPMALLPSLNAQRFGDNPASLGLLYSAIAVGGALAAAFAGRLGHQDKPGRSMLVTSVAWAIVIMALGLATSLWLAIALLVLAGALDSLIVVFRATIVQLETPNHLRGRVSAAEYIVGSASSQLGGFRAGLSGSWLLPAAAVLMGGACALAAIALIHMSLPAFARRSQVTASSDPKP